MSVSRIYLVGFMGSGKTTVGRRLAKKLGWKFIDLDEEIERRERRPVAEIFREHGETHFRQIERDVFKKLAVSAAADKSVMALGGGTFLDGENRAVAETRGLT